MSTRSELSSLATGLHDLAGRITAIADGLDPREADEYGTTLFEVERVLRTAERRLNKLIDR
jgi:hypothetical protein